VAATGTSRTDRVLEPSFVDGLRELPIEELRQRRDEALAEREFQSYLRRLVQVRQDLVRGEKQRRTEGREPAPLVERVTSVLSEGPRRGPSRGEALSHSPSPEDMAEADRQADAATGGALSDPASLDDARLEAILEALAQEERAISARRLEVLRVHDRFQDELKRRYRDDPSLIPTEI